MSSSTRKAFKVNIQYKKDKTFFLFILIGLVDCLYYFFSLKQIHAILGFGQLFLSDMINWLAMNNEHKIEAEILEGLRFISKVVFIHSSLSYAKKKNLQTL